MASAAPTAPHIWPVPGLYGLERSACGSDTTQSGNTAIVAPALCAKLDADARKVVGQRFVDAMAFLAMQRRVLGWPDPSSHRCASRARPSGASTSRPGPTPFCRSR
jgi:hypothetical protein